MANVLKSVSLWAGAGLLFVGTSVAAQACAANSFIITGCFTSITGSLVPGGAAGYQELSANNAPSLTLTGSSTPLSTVTVDVISNMDKNPFTLTLANFILNSGVATFAANDSTKHTLTFFAAVAQNNLVFTGTGNGQDQPVNFEIGHFVGGPSPAPAPIPGAGFLSFLGMGFASLWRRGKSVATRLLGGLRSATA